jgi:putative restriction endonuclease
MTVKLRLHQRTFRERVLEAYREQCALCRLHHRELLDAAHIIPDSDPMGEPHVTNGLSLCKLHHAAFDGNFIGIRPDYIIEVRPDLLKEKDGPMLKHGLQGMHENRIILPRSASLHPDQGLLEQRYALFKKAV